MENEHFLCYKQTHLHKVKLIDSGLVAGNTDSGCRREGRKGGRSRPVQQRFLILPAYVFDSASPLPCLEPRVSLPLSRAADGAHHHSPLLLLLCPPNSGNVTPTAPPYLQDPSPRAAHREMDDPRQLREVMRPELLSVVFAVVSHVQYGCTIASPDAGGVPVINCRVCQSLITLDGKLHQHVVKCTVCNEATPIKNPPTGKKYVRCPCNCLLICKDTSRRIGCPRPNCRRIINLSPVMVIPEEQPAQPALPVQPEGMRVVCGHCGNTFLGSDDEDDECSQPSSGLAIRGPSDLFKWMELRFNTLAKCPHCKKISSVGSALPRRRCCAYITVGTQDFARRYHATYVSWAFAYLLGLICLVRACYWGAIKVSYPENTFA
ncbi:Type 2 phosphatidylinositol 4,5-bisphosphate 4-phosphatase [Labeo rohita]|uniref:Phosphatidylinositol-4,5-bisphosphate 4-phosphatase n=1 Tax=Labeo rohita TaxID=84645 RepID=A0ABQ8LR38_LABRO|nr:Type 2 phosphatidylinositol 4,5-bisphosphate 4-phosphatase [Labeo rohita]